MRLVANAKFAARVVNEETLWTQLSAAFVPACHRQFPQILTNAAQPWLSQVRAQHLIAPRLQQQCGEGLLLDGLQLCLCGKSHTEPAMTLGLPVVSHLHLCDLCFHGLGQGSVPVAQRHQDYESLTKLWIRLVSKATIAW